METIVFAGPKGGIGRTTLAVHLAVEYALWGARVKLVDADPFGSATYWAERTQHPIAHDSTEPDRIGAALRLAKCEGCGLAIVDTSLGLRGRELTALLAHATLVVVPIPPSEYDYVAINAELAYILAANVPIATVISRAQCNDGGVGSLRRLLEGRDIHVLDTEIHEHIEYAMLPGEGQVAGDIDAHCEAALEVRALRREVQTLLGGRTSNRSSAVTSTGSPVARGRRVLDTGRVSGSEVTLERADSGTLSATPTRRKRDVKHITLRVSKQDWMLLTSFAMQRETSIQRFVLDCMNEMLARSSIGLLTGPEPANGQGDRG